jgi:hypothetical protein
MRKKWGTKKAKKRKEKENDSEEQKEGVKENRRGKNRREEDTVRFVAHPRSLFQQTANNHVL